MFEKVSGNITMLILTSRKVKDSRLPYEPQEVLFSRKKTLYIENFKLNIFTDLKEYLTLLNFMLKFNTPSKTN